MADGTHTLSEEKDNEATPEKIAENSSPIGSCSDDDSDDDIRCDICNKAFSGVKPYEQHLKGRKHSKAANRLRSKAKMAAVESNESTIVDKGSLPLLEMYETCEPCGKEFGAPESYQQHLASKGHKRKVVEHAILEQVREAGNVNMDLLKEMYKRKFGKNTEKRDAGETSVELKESPPSSTHDKSFEDLSEDTYECKSCKKAFSGLAPFIQHLQSKRHSKVEKEMEFYKMLKANSTGKFKTSPMSQLEKLTSCLQISEGIITCELCKASFTGYESALSHLKGKRHSGKLEILEWRKEHKQKDSMEGEHERSASGSSIQESHTTSESHFEGATAENADNFKDGNLNDKHFMGKETSI